jgi:hypothetical protein
MDTDTLMDVLWFKIEAKIQEDYEDEQDEEG